MICVKLDELTRQIAALHATIANLQLVIDEQKAIIADLQRALNHREDMDVPQYTRQEVKE